MQAFSWKETHPVHTRDTKSCGNQGKVTGLGTLAAPSHNLAHRCLQTAWSGHQPKKDSIPPSATIRPQHSKHLNQQRQAGNCGPLRILWQPPLIKPPLKRYTTVLAVNFFVYQALAGHTLDWKGVFEGRTSSQRPKFWSTKQYYSPLFCMGHHIPWPHTAGTWELLKPSIRGAYRESSG